MSCLETFLDQNTLLLDVRSPSEFAKGHIPGAVSFPLFSDQERAEVGTLYKKEGKKAAIQRGLQLVGPKLSLFVLEAEKSLNSAKTLRLYCARGGMRSSSMAWLLELYGVRCLVLKGGYKVFRRWVINQWIKPYPFRVLGGFTGSGKTELLQKLSEQGAQMIDLERLACHRGSSFGSLGFAMQPSIEHFENLLARCLSQCDLSRPIWVEDESRMIGHCCLPTAIWSQMEKAPFFWLEDSHKQRVLRLVQQYGSYSIEQLSSSILRLSKKLGLVKAKALVSLLEEGKLEEVVESLLQYYDKSYLYACQKRHKTQIPVSKESMFYIEPDAKLC